MLSYRDQSPSIIQYSWYRAWGGVEDAKNQNTLHLYDVFLSSLFIVRVMTGKFVLVLKILSLSKIESFRNKYSPNNHTTS